jgi:hypothetical protein
MSATLGLRYLVLDPAHGGEPPAVPHTIRVKLLQRAPIDVAGGEA